MESKLDEYAMTTSEQQITKHRAGQHHRSYLAIEYCTSDAKMVSHPVSEISKSLLLYSNLYSINKLGI
jgi:hypothetical protein